MTKDKSLDHYLRLIEQTDKAGKPLLIVGGQAVNFWANKYASQEKGLKEFEPYTSDDIDFYGLKDEARAVAKALGVEIKITKKAKASPVSAFFEVVGPNGTKMPVHFLHNLRGIKDELITSSAVEGDWKGIPVRVTNPIVSLQGKISCLHELDQDDRQDEKHVRILILCSRAFIKDLCREAEDSQSMTKDLIKTCNRLAEMLSSKKAKAVSVQYGFDFMNVFPEDALRKIEDQRMAHFLELGFPRIAQKLAQK